MHHEVHHTANILWNAFYPRGTGSAPVHRNQLQPNNTGLFLTCSVTRISFLHLLIINSWSKQISAAAEQKLAANQCDPPSCYCSLLPLGFVQRPLAMMHSWFQRFHSKLVETWAVHWTTPRIQELWTEADHKPELLWWKRGLRVTSWGTMRLRTLFPSIKEGNTMARKSAFQAVFKAFWCISQCFLLILV